MEVEEVVEEMVEEVVEELVEVVVEVSPQLYQLPENQGPEYCLKGSKMAKFPPFNQVLQRVFLTFFCKNGHIRGKMERVNSYIGG